MRLRLSVFRAALPGSGIPAVAGRNPAARPSRRPHVHDLLPGEGDL